MYSAVLVEAATTLDIIDMLAFLALFISAVFAKLDAASISGLKIDKTVIFSHDFPKNPTSNMYLS